MQLDSFVGITKLVKPILKEKPTKFIPKLQNTKINTLNSSIFMKGSARKAMFAKRKTVDIILHPDGDHVQGIVETNVPNNLWNKKADMYGTSNVKGYNGWKDKDGQKRDYSSSTRENYVIQSKASIKSDIE